MIAFFRSFPLRCNWLAAALLCLCAGSLTAQVRHIPLALQPDDVVPTGNEWIALPDIRASDGALTSFNVLSMRDRGLLQVTGERARPSCSPTSGRRKAAPLPQPLVGTDRVLDSHRPPDRRTAWR